MLTRNQAHGSPANLLDFYAIADIPETEVYLDKCNPLLAKFASSAAHVAGHQRASSETGTWLTEHWQTRLYDLKHEVDGLFIGGINHIFYHGCCYSPDDAAWPGWQFYAASEVNPRNAIWHDLPALNQYIARCQSILAAGAPDNDVLLYWPIHDFWQDSTAMGLYLTMGNAAAMVHAAADRRHGRGTNQGWHHLRLRFGYDVDRRHRSREEGESRWGNVPGYRRAVNEAHAAADSPEVAGLGRGRRDGGVRWGLAQGCARAGGSQGAAGIPE